jgi:hypothetical protein
MHPIARLVVVILFVAPATLHAQRTPREVHLDVTALGGSVGYAVPTGSGRLFGVQVGLGGDFINRTLVGGRHFKDDGGDNMFEMAHLAVFQRSHVARRFSLDVGLRIGTFIHGTDGDDDVSFAGFAGAYAMPMFTIGGGRRFSIGPRIFAGVLTEGNDSEEFAVNVAALTGRVTFGR